MPADLPTREEAELVCNWGDIYGYVAGDSIQACGDLALRVLDSPERTLTPAERAAWGTCPVCRAEQGETCEETSADGYTHVAGTEQAHTARLDAAPMRVRMVAVP